MKRTGISYSIIILPISSNRFTHSGSILFLSLTLIYCSVATRHAFRSFSRISSLVAVLDNASWVRFSKVTGAKDRHIGIYSALGDKHFVVGLR